MHSWRCSLTVISALNGGEVLERLKETKPDLIVIDFMMPILDGDGVIKALRSDEKLRDIPVILASVLPEQIIKEGCDGFDSLLRKPFKPERLLEENVQITCSTGSPTSWKGLLKTTSQIRDDGCGFDGTIRKEIFEWFMRGARVQSDESPVFNFQPASHKITGWHALCCPAYMARVGGERPDGSAY